MTASTAGSKWLLCLAACLAAGATYGFSLADLTNQDATRGIKGALSTGAASAIDKLGVSGGFMNNPKVKIPLPRGLDEVAKGMRLMGRGKEADDLVAAMNEAAERPCPKRRG